MYITVHFVCYPVKVNIYISCIQRLHTNISKCLTVINHRFDCLHELLIVYLIVQFCFETHVQLFGSSLRNSCCCTFCTFNPPRYHLRIQGFIFISYLLVIHAILFFNLKYLILMAETLTFLEYGIFLSAGASMDYDTQNAYVLDLSCTDTYDVTTGIYTVYLKRNNVRKSV